MVFANDVTMNGKARDNAEESPVEGQVESLPQVRVPDDQWDDNIADLRSYTLFPSKLYDNNVRALY
jgi:hypothetical protein